MYNPPCFTKEINVAQRLAIEICAKQWSRWWNSYHYFHAWPWVLRQTLVCSPPLQNGSLPRETFFPGLITFSLYYSKHVLTTPLPPLTKLPRQWGEEFRPCIVADHVHFQWQLHPLFSIVPQALSASPCHLTTSLGSCWSWLLPCFQICKFHFFCWVPNALVHPQQTLLMSKPCHLCVSSIF